MIKRQKKIKKFLLMTTFLLGLFIKNLLFKFKSVGLSHCHNSHTEKELNGME
jgi:hypothetical protein